MIPVPISAPSTTSSKVWMPAWMLLCAVSIAMSSTITEMGSA